MSAVRAASGERHASPSDQPRSVDNVVHALIAISNDLGRHISEDLRRRGYDDRRPSFAPLFALIWDKGVPQGRLAEDLGISTQAASQTTSLAEQAGYVTREPNPNDGRSKIVTMSDRGRRFVGHGAEAIHDRSAQHADHVGLRRLNRFEGSVAMLQAALGLDADATMVTTIEPRSAMVAVMFLAKRATNELRQALVDGGHGDIRAAQTTILVHIGPKGARANEIARAQQVSRQAVSSTLHEIEALGYLERQHDDDDARGVVFVPTRRGQQLLDDYVAEIDAIEARYEAVLGPVRFAQFAQTARDLRHRLRLESTLGDLPFPTTSGADSPSSRTEGELFDIAAHLHLWLGDTDSVRLGSVLSRLAVEGTRSAGSPASARRRARDRALRDGGR